MLEQRKMSNIRDALDSIPAVPAKEPENVTLDWKTVQLRSKSITELKELAT